MLGGPLCEAGQAAVKS